MSEVDKLLDALERQSELIAGLRNELHVKDKRITELEQSANLSKDVADARLTEMEHQAQRIAELESAANIAYVKKLACEVQS